MGTAAIEHRGNDWLQLVEELRQRRALKWSEPGGGQIIPIELLDRTILSIILLGSNAGELSSGDLARFIEAWNDR
jgi:hypothetical protein